MAHGSNGHGNASLQITKTERNSLDDVGSPQEAGRCGTHPAVEASDLGIKSDQVGSSRIKPGFLHFDKTFHAFANF